MRNVSENATKKKKDEQVIFVCDTAEHTLTLYARDNYVGVIITRSDI